MNIPPRARRCYKEQEDFSPGGEYYSLLEVRGSEDYERRDYCPNCWDKEREQVASRKIFWKSRIPLKNEPQPEILQRGQQAFSLLKELVQSGKEEAQVFVLALFLVRSRLLRLLKEAQEESGAAILLYEVVETEEILCIKKPHLSSIQVEEIRKALADKLSTEATKRNVGSGSSINHQLR